MMTPMFLHPHPLQDLHLHLVFGGDRWQWRSYVGVVGAHEYSRSKVVDEPASVALITLRTLRSWRSVGLEDCIGL